MLLALLNGKAGGQITGADLSRIEDPILGILTGSYTPQQDAGPNLNDLSYEKRPTWESLLNNEYYDENSLEMRIARSVSDGVPLMEIKKQIPQLLAASGQPAGPNDTTTQDLISFATKLDSENRDYNVAVKKATADKNQNSWWAKAGISDPSLQADPAQILNPQLERLAKMYKPLTDPNKTGGYMGSGGRYIEGGTQPDAAKELTDKRRIQADTRQAAESKLQNRSDVPYEYGGAPGVTDLFVGMNREANRDLRSGNLGGLLSYISGTSLLQGAGNVAGDFISRTARDVFTDPEGKKQRAREAAYIEDKVRNSTNTEDSRERDRMIVRRDAMGGRPAANKIPIRTAKLNKEMEDRALQVAALLKERADREAAKLPTPAQTDVMNRILSLAMAERLKK